MVGNESADLSRNERIGSVSDKHNKGKSAVSRVDQERRLQALLREHERICDEIIAIVSEASVETERLIGILEKEKTEKIITPYIQ